MLLLTLFAISWPTVISGFLGVMVCAAILLWVVWTKKKSDGNVIGDVSNKAKSLAGDAADKAKAGAESLKDGVSQLAGDDPTEDLADAVEAAAGDADLPDVELPNIEVPNVDVEPPAVDLLDPDVPEVELPEVELPGSIETADVESSIDDVLSGENTFEIKDPLPTSDASISNPTSPTPTLGATVPPPPPRPQAPTQSSFASSTPNPGAPASGIPPRGSSIPPRREPSPTQPPIQAAASEPQAIVPEPDEIEVLDDAPHIASFQSSGGATAAEQQELAELRLTLEASHNELTHLTTQRDQALSRAVQHEEELSQLRQQVENLSATSEALQQDRQKIAQLESEIETLRSQAASGDNEEAIRAIEKQHQATIEELRLIIGQREAAEASLSRERDNLSAQNDDLRRKVETGDAPQVDPNEFASLQMQHQQSASELSLSNETIRQLNQNLNQRDAQLMSLRNEVQSLTTKLAETEQAATESTSEPDAAVIEEIETQHKATVKELRSIIDEREAAEAKLASEREKLSAEASELREKTIQLEEALAGAKDETAQAASQESPEHSLANETIRQLNQNLTQRDAELFNLRRELQSAQTQLTAAEESDSSGEDSSEQVTLLETKMKELEADRNRIRDEFASARERLHEELASAKESEAGAKAESETSQRQVSEQAAVIEQLRDERRNRQDELATLQAKVAESNDASVIEKLTAERDSALSRYDKLQIDLAHAVQDTSNNDDSSEELELLKTKLAEKSAEFDAVQAEHHTLKARFTAETEALKGRLESLQDSSSKENVAESNNEDESSESLSNTTAKIAELETVIEQHEQYAAGLQTERQDLLDQLGASQEDINVKAAEMRRMREQLQAAQSQASTAAEQQSEFSASQSECRELSKSLEERGADLKRLQDEQIELKQQLAHFIDAEELWNTQRTSLYSRLDLDENGEPLDDDSLHAAENGESERVEALTKLLAERDEAIEKLDERFQSLNEMYSSRDEASVLHDDASDPEDALRAERDQAAASAAEASATIAKLMGELNELKSNEVDANQISKLEEENREYRRSVAELHASVNELEELKLSRVREQESSRQKLMEAARANAELSTKLEELQAQTDQSNEAEAEAPANAEELATLKKLASALKRERDEQRKTIGELQEEIEATPKDRKEGTKAVRDVKRLTTKIDSQEKKLHDRDDRLQDLAAELSKLRVEASALRNEVAEQKAVVRALNKGEDVVPTPAKRRTTTKATKNGKPAKATKKTATKKSATKKTTKRPAKTRPAAKATKSKTATKKQASKPAKKVVAKDPTPRKKDPNLGMVYTKRPKSIDDLKQISGVGPVLEKRLNKAGIYQFSQVKDWGKKTIDYLDDELNLGGRIRREKWINQAKRLAK